MTEKKTLKCNIEYINIYKHTEAKTNNNIHHQSNKVEILLLLIIESFVNKDRPIFNRNKLFYYEILHHKKIRFFFSYIFCFHIVEDKLCISMSFIHSVSLTVTDNSIKNDRKVVKVQEFFP